MENIQLSNVLQKINPNEIIKLILSNKRNGFGDCNKIVIQPVKRDGELCFKAESFTEKQAFHKTVLLSELFAFIEKQLAENFRQLDGILANKSVTVKISKKGKILYTEKKNSDGFADINFSHNREKNYILPQGTYVPALYELGIISKDGKVLNSGFDKFKQINRFVEIVDDSIKNIDGDSVNVIDFGCGKSYLTFVLYYYLTEIKKLKANVIGLDLKKDVIEKCNATAQKYGYENLHFFCGDIKDYRADFHPNIVMTLHACDTATDYALYNSVVWEADYIFSVPCCQHEVNGSINAKTLSGLTDYGIVKERLSALITDTVRCKLLEYSGYSVDLMEFIDIAHSPKNLLIRAKKANIPNGKKKDSIEKVHALKNEFGFDQTLYNLLYENKRNKEV